ncbi:MAG: phytanoyl-CoA dioxygenase family protein [Myxococcaceae bacterium]
MLNNLSKSLVHISDQKTVLGFMRHCAREPIPPGTIGNEVKITPQGIRDTLRVQKLLGGRVAKLYSSPVSRCLETANLLSPIARVSLVNQSSKLGAPGVFVEDPEVAAMVFLQYQDRPIELAQALINEVKFSGFYESTSISIQGLIDYFLAEINEPGISICVTHDSILGVMIGYFFPESSLQELWPDYLDTLFIQADHDDLFAIYRGVKKQINYSRAQTEFKRKGFRLLNRVLGNAQVQNTYKTITDNIEKCALQLDCSMESYLKVISRWTHPSPVTKEIIEQLEADFQKVLREIFQQEIELAEFSVILKSMSMNRVTPCHQDISYTPQNQYDFSMWLPLQDVTLGDGVFELLPESHLGSISSAVDYWQPNFIDEMRRSSLWKNNFKAIPTEAGDSILFDSRIWHGSDANRTGNDRFAIVTRWRLSGDRPSYIVPEKTYSEFGIWTCGEATKNLLQQGLKEAFNLELTGDLGNYIELWFDFLGKEYELPFAVNTEPAKRALENLLILNEASRLHNGGDMQGIIYQTVWKELLAPLSKWLRGRI